MKRDSDGNLTSELTGRQRRDRMSASAAASGAENIVFSYRDLKEAGVRADHTCSISSGGQVTFKK